MTCIHPGPQSFGASDVTWRGNTGSLFAPCDSCGEWLSWEVQQ